MIYLKLFLSFFQIGLFSIGGGYAAIPFIQNQVVQTNHWLTMEQFADIVAIAEMTPGPITINAATFVGTQVLGMPGALTATLGCILPSAVIVLLLGKMYQKYNGCASFQTILTYIRPAVIAMICSAGLSLFLLALFPETKGYAAGSQIDVLSLLLFLLSFFLIRWKKCSPIMIILLSGVLRVILWR